MRLDSLLSRYGYCSRRSARGWLKSHEVSFKGLPCERPEINVDVHNVMIDGQKIEFPDGLYVALNKPAGYTCSHDAAEGTLIYDLLPERWMSRNPAIMTVGRLDKETRGLLLVTDDGQWAHRLTSPRHYLSKVYEVETETPIPTEAVSVFESGQLTLRAESKACAPAELELLTPRRARVTLREGKYHQVRRMFAAVGAPVLDLRRVSVGRLDLCSLSLEEGEWRAISPDDV